ncbi:MAG: hypothetical protein CMJ46_01655 [Planctomyces sp.]|nr:hypothetical protein [Planctomyces sp.]
MHYHAAVAQLVERRTRNEGKRTGKNAPNPGFYRLNRVLGSLLKTSKKHRFSRLGGVSDTHEKFPEYRAPTKISPIRESGFPRRIVADISKAISAHRSEDSGQAGCFGQSLNLLSQFMNTREGQMASINNTIALLTQKLGVLDTYRQRRDVVGQIQYLQGELARLSQPVAPLFTGMSGDSSYVDPATQQNSGQNGSYSVNAFFPNVAGLSQADVSQLYDMLQQVAAQRGRLAY